MGNWIQLMLWRSSVQATESYYGTKQDLVHSPTEAIKW
jgi:hypothetical protein